MLNPFEDDDLAGWLWLSDDDREAFGEAFAALARAANETAQDLGLDHRKAAFLCIAVACSSIAAQPSAEERDRLLEIARDYLKTVPAWWDDALDRSKRRREGH